MLYSFSLKEGTIEQYQRIIPISQHKKVFKDFLLNTYQLPEDLSQLQENVKNVEIIVLHLSDLEVSKFESLLLAARQQGFQLSKSALIRDIYKKIIEKYINNPLPDRSYHRQTFKVPVGTKERIAQFVQDRTRTYELSNFILNEYKPSNEFTSMRGKEQENFDFKADSEVFEKLDAISKEFGFKKGGRAKIFRDALLQFESYIQQYPPKEKVIEQQLKNAITEYKILHHDTDILKEKVNRYLQ
ncbi:MAG: hypothetical protein ACI4OT_05440 [Bacilli bacterium]